MAEPYRAEPAPVRERPRADPTPGGVEPRPTTIPLRHPRRSRIDSLAIGSPLAAAFVGALIGEFGGHVPEAGAAGVEAGATSARSGSTTGEASAAGQTSTLPEEAYVPDILALQPTSLKSAGAASYEPAAGSPTSMAAAQATVAEGQLVPEASASLSAKAGSESAPSYSYSFGSGGGGGAGSGLQEASAAFTDAGPGDIGSYVVGTDGDDLIIGTAADDRLFGEDGDDTIYGREGDDLLDGGAGNDRLFGEEGDDVLLGQTGNDLLDGGPGNDDLFGGEGDDILRGQQGRDELDGGDGNDILDGGPGPDVLEGGPGNDVAYIDDRNDFSLEDLDGVDTVVIEEGYWESVRSAPESAGFNGLEEGGVTFRMHDDLDPGALPAGTKPFVQGMHNVENLTLKGSASHDIVGNESDNRFLGNDGDNRVYGLDGDDILDGRGGDDVIDGGNGDDILRGFIGADTLRGRGGDDTYQLSSQNSETVRISDNVGHNRIEFESGVGGAITTREIGGDLFIFAEGHDNPVAIVSNYDPSKFSGIDDLIA